MGRPSTMEDLLLEQPDREHRLGLLWVLRDYVPSKDPAHYLISDDEYADLVDRYVRGHNGEKTTAAYDKRLTAEHSPAHGCTELYQICQGKEYQATIVGNTYCRLGMNGKRIDCPFHSDQPDHNGLRTCEYRSAP